MPTHSQGYGGQRFDPMPTHSQSYGGGGGPMPTYSQSYGGQVSRDQGAHLHIPQFQRLYPGFGAREPGPDDRHMARLAQRRDHLRNMRYDGGQGGTPFAYLDQRQQTEASHNHNKALTYLAKDETVIGLDTCLGTRSSTEAVHGLDAIGKLHKWQHYYYQWRIQTPQDFCYLNNQTFLETLMPRLLTDEFKQPESQAHVWFRGLPHHQPEALRSWDAFAAAFQGKYCNVDGLWVYKQEALEADDISHYVIRGGYYGFYKYCEALDARNGKFIALRGHGLHHETLLRVMKKHWRHRQEELTGFIINMQERCYPVNAHTLRWAMESREEAATRSNMPQNQQSGGYPPHISSRALKPQQHAHTSDPGHQVRGDGEQIYQFLEGSTDTEEWTLLTAAHMDAIVEGPGGDALLLAIQRGEFQMHAQKCHHCNKFGHFVRDCTLGGGTGISNLGERVGTAKGFREGDEPGLRPEKYMKHRAEIDKKRAEFAAKRSNQKQKPTKGGATHARRLRTGMATNPPVSHYQVLNQMLESATHARRLRTSMATNPPVSHYQGLN